MNTPCDCATASGPRRARILLAEKGLAHGSVPIDLMKAEQAGDTLAATCRLASPTAAHKG